MSDSDQLVVLDTQVVKAIATGFLRRAEDVRAAVQTLIKESPFAAHAAMVAGEFAIRDAMTDEDKAFIQRCKKEGKLLCEGGGSPTVEKCYDVVAEAAAKMLRFPSKDFSVWTIGTLYVKEDGFRQLLKVEGWSAIDPQTDPPVWKRLQDRSYWEVAARASARRNGVTESVNCLVGVNGNATDGIEKILSHATRSILKRLHKKCSSILLEFDGEDDSNVVDVGANQPESPRIEEQPTQTPEPKKEQDPKEKAAATVAEQLRQMVEDAKTEKDLDNMSVAIRKSKAAGELDQDKFNFLKTMVVTARERMKEAT